MSFTDEELKHLKDLIADNTDCEYINSGLDFIPRLKALLARLESSERIQEGQRCPHCPDRGWFPTFDANTGGEVQTRCEWCWTNPQSVYRLKEAWLHSKGE